MIVVRRIHEEQARKSAKALQSPVQIWLATTFGATWTQKRPISGIIKHHDAKGAGYRGQRRSPV